MLVDRDKSRSVMPRDEAVALVSAAYRLLLGREVDAAGLDAYASALARGRDVAWLLHTLGASDEYRDRMDPIAARIGRSGLAVCSENALSQELQRGEALPRARYDALWTQIFASGVPLIVGQADYGVTHRERFFELMNAALVLTRGCRSPRLLEFGPSEFSAMYAQLIPDLELVLVDRPVPPDYVGFTEARCRASLGCAGYAAVDLARPADMDEKLGPLGAFDLIVLCEVIEHLPIHPVDLIARLLRLLTPGGRLYLTTPNFFAQARLAALARGENPCAVYPAGDGNWDAHHHYREYEAVELAEFIQASAGSVEAFCFSGCWDDAGTTLPMHRRGNMVYVTRRALVQR
jgi:SAM-dependent methyltransferase